MRTAVACGWMTLAAARVAEARGAWRCATGTGAANARSEGLLLPCLVVVCLHIVDGSDVAVAVIECRLLLHHHHPPPPQIYRQHVTTAPGWAAKTGKPLLNPSNPLSPHLTHTATGCGGAAAAPRRRACRPHHAVVLRLGRRDGHVHAGYERLLLCCGGVCTAADDCRVVWRLQVRMQARGTQLMQQARF